MNSLIDLLAFGIIFESMWATTFTIVFVLAAIVITASEEIGLSYFALIVYLVLMAMFTPFNPFTYVWHHPSEAFGFLVIYFAIGAIYSFIKYWSYVKKMVKMVRGVKLRFIETNQLRFKVTDEVPSEFIESWKRFKDNALSYHDKDRINELSPAKNKALISTWIAFWPFSAIGLFVANPLNELVNAIYDAMTGLYRKTYEKLVSKYINIKDL